MIEPACNSAKAAAVGVFLSLFRFGLLAFWVGERHVEIDLVTVPFSELTISRLNQRR
jgi:hypothetical protein